MKFIHYFDEYGRKNYFDATQVTFTLSQQVGPVDENGKVQKWATKVALAKYQGYIIADEPSDEIIARIEAANGIS
tara:strand:- start:878 stop:1102 length:225 start_codon:yes stop_codon:yes gene_type:complete